ncbi:TPA: hypothetical protein ACN023_003774, partial [Shigella boydii]
TSRIRHFSLYLCTVLHGTEFLTLRIVMSVGGGATCSLKRETRLSARNTEIKKTVTFLQGNRVKIIFIF